MGADEKTARNLRAGQVRETDVEPYTALRWVGTLFKSAAVFFLVAIIAEFVAGLRLEGTAALPLLLGELARTAVITVALWGAGDFAQLLIHVGHDIRAQRLLLARVAHRLPPLTDIALPEAPPERPRVRTERQHHSPEEPGPEAAAD